MSFTVKNEKKARRFIRHPSDIPMIFRVGKEAGKSQKLRDVSSAGLCFGADRKFLRGETVHIEIALDQANLQAEGVVVWCKPDGDQFRVGLQFNDENTAYSVRMMEQICHIEDYRTKIKMREGRDIGSEDAAKEWIEKFAQDFPSLLN